MKKAIFTLIAIFSIALTFGQDRLSIKLQGGYPIPNSEFTFQENYEGIITGGISFQQPFTKGISFGIGMRYHLFQLKELPLFDETQMQVLNPAFVLSWTLNPDSDFQIEVGGDAGYSFVSFINEDLPLLEFKQDGFSVRPQLTLKRRISDNLFVDLNGSYYVLFQEFGEANPLSSIVEDPTTRFIAIELGVQIKL